MVGSVVREMKMSDFDQLMFNYFSFYDEVEENPLFGLVLFNHKPTVVEEVSWFLGTFRSMLEGNAVVEVAEVDNKIVGMCEVSRKLPNSPVSHRGGLGISIIKEYRGKGVGEALVRETLEKCKGKFEIVELEVFVGNDVAKRLYERCGFKTYGLRHKAVKRDGRYIDEELMYLELH